MSKTYDAIIIGAGSVGMPAALFLTQQKLKVLVIDSKASPGQGQNKTAIGGVRATHSDPAKILLCKSSLEFFGKWENTYGVDIGWKKGGYCYPVYNPDDEKLLKSLIPNQKMHGLNIDWVTDDIIRELIPGINPEGLIGGTYSCDDAHISPLLAVSSIFKETKRGGCDFRFNEKVIDIEIENRQVRGVTTNKESYQSSIVVNAAGAGAREIGKLNGLDLPVVPDSHEAGITSPVESFINPVVVDIRPGKDGKTLNFYFTQNKEGQIIFCYTPNPPFIGNDRNSTSEFLPIIARRMIELLPRLKNTLVRRTWRGLYPMTPDGEPICCEVDGKKGLFLAVGMCGQGFMLGPGIGKNLTSLICNGKPEIDPLVFDSLRLSRDFKGSKKEILK